MTADLQTAGPLAFDATGRLSITFANFNGDNGRGAFLRRFAPNGSPVGASVFIHPGLPIIGRPGAVAIDQAGRTMVLYRYGVDLFGAVFNVDGTPRTGQFYVDSAPGFDTPNFSDRGYPQLVAGPDGTFLATWVSTNQDGSAEGIYAQLLTVDGMRLGREFRVNTSTAGAQTWPALAAGPDGNYTIAWGSADPAGPAADGIFAQRFSQYLTRSSVSGRAWMDSDGDRVRGSAEPPAAAGNAVRLYHADGQLVDETTTAVDGTYSFELLRPGDSYRVAFDAPAGNVFAPPDRGDDDARDSDVVYAFAGQTATFVAPAAGTTAGKLDAGFITLTTIAGVAYRDANLDDVREAGEEPLAGLRVFLDTDGDGVFEPDEPTVVTSADGGYSFGSLLPGSYLVNVVPNAPWAVTSPVSSLQVSLTSGQTATVNVALRPTDRATVGGVVFDDADGDGVRDSGETTRSGVAVELLNGVNVSVASTTTAADGTYRFDDLAAGTFYRVRFVPSPGTSFGPRDAAGADEALDSDVDPATGTSAAVAYAAGQVDLRVGAALVPLGRISGHVFADADADGVRDAGEGALAGRIVFLDVDVDGRLDAGEPTSSTDVNGIYGFTDVRPGPQRVEMLAQPGWAATTPLTRRAIVMTPAQNVALDVGLAAAAPAAPIVLPAGNGEIVATPSNQPLSIDPYDWFAGDAQGGFVATAEVLGSTDYDVVGRAYLPSGAPAGAQFNAASTPDGGQLMPAVGRAPGGGGFVVAWTGPWISARRFSAAGTPLGPQFVASGDSPGALSAPSVAVEPDGDFVIAWEQAGQGNDVYARRFDAAGNARGDAFLVNTTTAGNQYSPDVATNAAGVVAVTWHDNDRIMTRRFDGSGAPLGAESEVSPDARGAVVRSATIALNASGQTAVVWQEPTSNGPMVKLARFDAKGVLIGTPVFAADAANARSPDVALRDDGSAVVTWQAPDGNDDGIFLRQFDASGLASTVAMPVNALTAGRQSQPMVALMTDGAFQIASRDAAGTFKVRRFDALPAPPAPATAGGFAWADADADGIYDAGEAPVAGLTVDLLQGAAVLRSVSTAADGSYRFSDLPIGTSYTLRYTIPGDSAVTIRDQGPDDTADSDADPLTAGTALVVPAAAGGTLDLNYGVGLIANPGPSLPSITIDDGTPQRSRVRSLTLTFDRQVLLAAGALKLELLNTGGSGANDGSAPADASSALGAPASNDGGRTWVVPMLSGGVFVDPIAGGAVSLIDGIYRFTIDATQVTALDGGQAMSSSATLTFHCLFGDTEGNKSVNNANYAAFRNAFGRSTDDAAYNAELDFDGNGTVNMFDFGQFRRRYAKAFTY